MANLSNINNKFIVTDGGNGRVLIGATNDIGATLFANHPSTTAPSLTFNAPAGQVFENEDLQIAFGLNNASPYNAYMQTRFVSAPYYRNLAINPLGGNVGIGTNSPAAKLDVEGGARFESNVGIGTAPTSRQLSVFRTTAGSIANFLHYTDASNFQGLYIQVSQTTDMVTLQSSGASGGGFIFSSGNAEKIRFTATGNVGIGTDSPDLGGVAGTRVLTIASPTAERWGILELAGNRTWGGNQVGELKFISTDSTNNGTLVSLIAINDPTATGTGGSLKFNTRANGGSLTEKMRITSGGNVGIGTISPVKKLVLDKSNSGGAGAYIRVQNEVGGVGSNVGVDFATFSPEFYSTTSLDPVAQIRATDVSSYSGRLDILVRGQGTAGVLSTVATFDRSGNVGIGTTTFASTSNLQLKMGNMGSGIVGEIFDAVDNADNSRIIVCGGGTGTPQFSMRHYSAGYGIDMWLNTSSPWDTYIDNRNAASGFIFRNNCNNDGGEDELMRITGSGNVGIGTPSPDYGKLQIDQTSGNNLTLRKGIGYASIAFGGVTNNEATFLIEGNASQGFKIYNGTGTLASPTWTAGMDFYDQGRLHPYGGVFLGSSNNDQLLSYYKEGNWTPEIYYQNATDQANATNVVQQGKFTRIGNLVFISFRLDFSQSGSPAADNIGVKNLPFNSANNHFNGGGNVVTSTSLVGLMLQTPTAGSDISIVNTSNNTGNFGNDFGSGTGKYIRGSMTYLAQ